VSAVVVLNIRVVEHCRQTSSQVSCNFDIIADGMGPPPVVTGISPKEGPPGTRVTMRGEFLGNKAQDLIG